MSAPFRYARILNGLSFLISSRSAISRRIRATAWLSNPKSLGFDAIGEEPGPAAGERGADRFMCGRWTVAEEAAAASGAAHFGCGRSGRVCAGDQIVNRRGRDTRREPLPVVPFDGNLPSNLVEVLAVQRPPHRDRRIADPLEAIENVAVAIDMTFCNFPVVRSRIPPRTRIREDDPAF